MGENLFLWRTIILGNWIDMVFMYTLLKFTKIVDFCTTFCYDVKVYKE